MTKKQYNPAMASAINNAMAAKPEDNKALNWDDAVKTDAMLGLTLSEIMKIIREIMKRPSVIEALNNDSEVASNVTMFTKSVSSITEQLRGIRSKVNGRTGLASESEMMELSQIYLEYMGISDKIASAKQNVSKVFATILSDDFAEKIDNEEKDNLQKLATEMISKNNGGDEDAK